MIVHTVYDVSKATLVCKCYYTCDHLFCTGISTHTVSEELDHPVAGEISTPTEDQPPTEKNQDSNNPAQGGL